MAFGQPSGPPASAKQVRELLELLQRAGHTDFRDARGPLGFTQRQAAGKFTRDEADAFIEQLTAELEAGESETGNPEVGGSASREPVSGTPRPPRRPSPRQDAEDQLLRRLPAERLAAELQRRGWVVMEP